MIPQDAPAAFLKLVITSLVVPQILLLCEVESAIHLNVNVPVVAEQRRVQPVSPSTLLSTT
ncbi:MAG: hypothetical protein U5Q44_12175 [Dehalococcoidia bacterium]|nr:hypothetical protein [Dehalococcoidia bacterium]